MEMYLPHGTRVLKTWVPEKTKNEDDHEDEEPEMKEEVPDLKTSLENADLKKQNRGGRSTTKSENLSGERRSEEENHGLEKRRTGEEEEAVQALGK